MAIGSGSSGADGYYYILSDASGLDANGAIAYLDGNADTGAGFGDVIGINGIQGLDVYSSAARLATGRAALGDPQPLPGRARQLCRCRPGVPLVQRLLSPHQQRLRPLPGCQRRQLQPDTNLGSGGLLSLDSGGAFGISGTRQLSAGGNPTWPTA